MARGPTPPAGGDTGTSASSPWPGADPGAFVDAVTALPGDAAHAGSLLAAWIDGLLTVDAEPRFAIATFGDQDASRWAHEVAAWYSRFGRVVLADLTGSPRRSHTPPAEGARRIRKMRARPEPESRRHLVRRLHHMFDTSDDALLIALPRTSDSTTSAAIGLAGRLVVVGDADVRPPTGVLTLLGELDSSVRIAVATAGHSTESADQDDAQATGTRDDRGGGLVAWNHVNGRPVQGPQEIAQLDPADVWGRESR